MEDIGGTGRRMLVVFDGHCGLCNGWVRWLLRRDGRGRLRFAAFERARELGYAVPEAIGLEEAGTLLVFRGPGAGGDRALARSDAVLAVLSELAQPWPILAAGLGWIPRSWRDFVYRAVARRRYRIAGHTEECPLPMSGYAERFL